LVETPPYLRLYATLPCLASKQFVFLFRTLFFASAGDPSALCVQFPWPWRATSRPFGRRQASESNASALVHAAWGHTSVRTPVVRHRERMARACFDRLLTG